MSRVVIVLSNLDQGHPDDDSEKLTEHDDDATLTGSHTAVLTCNQYVVYSATFQVPAFYFTLSDTSAAHQSLSVQLLVLTALQMVRCWPYTTSRRPRSSADIYSKEQNTVNSLLAYPRLLRSHCCHKAIIQHVAHHAGTFIRVKHRLQLLRS